MIKSHKLTNLTLVFNNIMIKWRARILYKVVSECVKNVSILWKNYFLCVFCFETEIMKIVVAKKNKVAKIPPHIANYR